MNALFVGDSRHDEVTWIGSIGIIVPGEGSNSTLLKFDAQTKNIQVSNNNNLAAKVIGMVSVADGKLIVTAASKKGYRSKYPKVEVNLVDVGVKFAVSFKKQNLDLS